MKVLQLTPSLLVGDAIGNDVVAIRKILEEEGYETDIYCYYMDPRLPKDLAKPMDLLPDLNEDDILLYHACTDSPMTYQLPGLKGKKVLIYHNITPPSFFGQYSKEVEGIQARALEGMRFLSDKVDCCIADSEFNRSDLIRFGFHCPIDVCPIIIPFEDYRQPPDQEIISRYKGDGWTNMLFVGRIAPNKKQEDIIRAFYCYQRDFNPQSRLILIGSSNGMELYRSRLELFIKKLDISDKVILPGHVRFSEILGFFSLADVFVCQSEHEGFCVPLIEAMLFRIPIVAYNCTAIPETLGSGGLLLSEKDPLLTAASVHRIVSDASLREYLVRQQQVTLSRFGYDKVRERFLECLRNV